MVLITSIGEPDHDEASEDVRRCDQAVGCRGAESHTVIQYNGEKIGDCVGDAGGKHVDQCEAPDLEIEGSGKVLSDVKFFGKGVMSIFFDARNEELRFLLGKELSSETGFVS
jgi:hypothetical protein